MSGKFQPIRFFLEGNLPNSLTSEEARQPWTTQKEMTALLELNRKVNPNFSYIHWVLPPNTHSKPCFTAACHVVTFGRPTDTGLILAESV